MTSRRLPTVFVVASLALGLGFPAIGPVTPGAAAQPSGQASGAMSAADTAIFSAMEARSIGPAVMSGRIAAVEGIAGSADTVFVGTATGGVWRTTNGGHLWEPIFDDKRSLSIGDVVVHPRNHDLIWVGTGEANVRNSVGVGRGVYKSIDGGETWSFVGLEDTEHIQEIRVDPDDPQTAYVAAGGPLWNDGGQRGVYRTTDGGETWDLILEGPNDRTGAADLVVDPKNPDKLVASLWERRRFPYYFKSGGPGSGLYISHDGGDGWEEVTPEDGLPEGPLGKIGLAIAPSNPDVIYALVEAKKNVLLKSTDGGESWRTVNESEGINYRPFYYGRMEVGPENADRVYIVAGDLRMSTDGGRSFEDITSWGKGVHVDHHALWIDPHDGSHLIDGNDGGVYVSNDYGEGWRFVKNLPVSQFYELSVDELTPYHVYGGLQDNGSWVGPGETWRSGGIVNYQWESIGGGDGFTALSDPNDPRYGWSTWQEGNIMRFDLETGAQRGIKPAPPSDTVDLRYNWNAPIAVSPHDPNTVYQGAQYVYRSTNDGLAWERISPDLTTDSARWQQQKWSGGLTLDATGAENYTTIYTLAPSPVQEGVIWAGTDDGNIHVTRDGGESWTAVHGDMPGKPRHGWVSHIEASKHDAGTAYAVVHDYMRGDWTTYAYRTADFGQSWERLPAGDVDGFARTIEEDPAEPNLLWMGTEFGLFYSLDGGQSWDEWSHGFPEGVPVRAITTQGPERDLVVGTYGRGVYIIDDIRPLREIARDPSLLDAPLHLFDPGSEIQHVEGGKKSYPSPGNTLFRGENEPEGATVTIAASVPDTGRQVREGQDVVVGRDSTEYEYTKVEAAPDTVREPPTRSATFQVVRSDSVIFDDDMELTNGLNRYTWDWDTEGFRGFPRSTEELRRALESPEEDEPDRNQGPMALPGSYTVRVVADEDTAATELDALDDPRLDVTAEDRRAKHDLMVRAMRVMETGTEALEGLRKARIRVERSLDLLGDQEDLANADSLRAQGQAVLDSLKALEEYWTGPEDEPQGISEFETVQGRVGGLSFRISDRYAPTEEERQRVEIARDVLEEAIGRTNRVLQDQVAPFGAALREVDIELLPEPDTYSLPGGP